MDWKKILVTVLTLSGCQPASLSKIEQIIGKDDRKPDVSKQVGLLWSSGPCTAFVTGPQTITTAKHCYVDGKLALFRLNGKTHRVTAVASSFASADIIELKVDTTFPKETVLTVSEEPLTANTERTMKIISMKYDFNIGKSELMVHEAKQQVQYDRGALVHQLDTTKGASGSPILINGRVWAIHLGASATDKNHNLAMPYQYRQQGLEGDLRFNHENSAIGMTATTVAAVKCIESDCINKVIDLVKSITDNVGEYVLAQQAHDNEMEKLRFQREAEVARAATQEGKGGEPFDPSKVQEGSGKNSGGERPEPHSPKPPENDGGGGGVEGGGTDKPNVPQPHIPYLIAPADAAASQIVLEVDQPTNEFVYALALAKGLMDALEQRNLSDDEAMFDEVIEIVKGAKNREELRKDMAAFYRRVTQGYEVSLQAIHGQYFSAKDGGINGLIANRSQKGEWETFTLIDLNGGTLSSGDEVVIMTSRGFFITAEGGGGGSIATNRERPGPWEKFKILSDAGDIVENSLVSLQSINGHYVTATDGGGSNTVANRQQKGEWETFTIDLTR